MQKKIKILHIQQSVSYGGVERRRLSMAKHLNKDIFEQKLVCTDARGPILERLNDEGVEVITIGKYSSIFDFKKYLAVQRIIDAYKPDIIHGAVFEGVTMAAVNGWLKKVPIVIIEETSFPIYRNWKANLLMKIFAKISNKVIGVSPAVTEEYLKGKLKLSKKKVTLINNGVALPREISKIKLQEAKKKWGVEEVDFVIGSVGRMLDDSNKRYSDLIKAFARFSKDKMQAKLILVGDGPERVKYEQIANEFGISKQVIFAGYQGDVSLFYQMMDVFALVSMHESFGLVLTEAMLNKLPVVATRVGGMKYIVEDDVTGFLVEPKNVASITEKLEKIYHNPELAGQMGKNGRKKALENYTEQQYVKRIEELYLSLVEKK